MTIQQQTEPAPAAVVPVERVPVVRQSGYNFRAAAVVGFLTGLVDLLIAARFVGLLLGASTQSAFVNFIYQVTAPMVAPFRGIFPASGSTGNSFEPAALVAILVYGAIGWGLVVLIRIVTAPRGTRPEIS